MKQSSFVIYNPAHNPCRDIDDIRVSLPRVSILTHIKLPNSNRDKDKTS